MPKTGRDTKSLDCLFNQKGSKLHNVKFFRGSDEFIAAETLRAQFIASVERSKIAKDSGVVSTPPKTRRTEKLDLHKIVADIA